MSDIEAATFSLSLSTAHYIASKSNLNSRPLKSHYITVYQYVNGFLKDD